jgi:hypothetical protein
MVPVPEYDTLEELNEYILQKCIEDEERQVRGQEQAIGEAWKEEQKTSPRSSNRQRMRWSQK